jgi:hypothetical protein
VEVARRVRGRRRWSCRHALADQRIGDARDLLARREDEVAVAPAAHDPELEVAGRSIERIRQRSPGVVGEEDVVEALHHVHRELLLEERSPRCRRCLVDLELEHVLPVWDDHARIVRQDPLVVQVVGNLPWGVRREGHGEDRRKHESGGETAHVHPPRGFLRIDRADHLQSVAGVDLAALVGVRGL